MAAHCVQQTATKCNTLQQHAATRSNTQQHAAARCNTLQHAPDAGFLKRDFRGDEIVGGRKTTAARHVILGEQLNELFRSLSAKLNFDVYVLFSRIEL